MAETVTTPTGTTAARRLVAVLLAGGAVALALGAALLHALWNLLLGGSRDVLAATAVALGSSLVLAAPVAEIGRAHV